ncbi:MAG: glycosyltransferase [Bacteroidales bacterium]
MSSSNTILVSVVMPCYNGALWLRDSIESVLGQTFRELELIIVDDGSTDNSLQIAQSYLESDSRVKIIEQSNQGQSTARNRGIDVAEGRYLYFIDCDDRIVPETLAELYQIAQENKLEMVLFDASTFYDKGVGKSSLPPYIRDPVDSYKIFTGAQLLNRQLKSGEYRASVCLYLTKRELVERLSLRFHRTIIHEDELYTPQLLYNAKRVSHIAKEYYQRRVRLNSVMTIPFSRFNIESYLTVIEQLRRSSLIDRDGAEVVDRVINIIIPVLTYRSHTLPLKERLSLIFRLAREGVIGRVPFKNLLLLLTPNFLKRGLKRIIKSK